MYRTFRTPSLWREMDRLQRDMNRLFNRYEGPGLRGAAGYPPVNIWFNENELVISAEMPGVHSEDLNLSVDRDTLTLSGVLGVDTLPEGARYHRKERVSGEFSRSIQLPYAVDSNAVDATFKDGVLMITLPRAEVDKPKKITIKS